jgi:hypothetical protein
MLPLEEHEVSSAAVSMSTRARPAKVGTGFAKKDMLKRSARDINSI